MYEVTNKTKDIRKFRYKGQDIIVEPNKSVLTDNPPKDMNVWEVKPFKVQQKPKRVIKEDKE